MEYKYIRYEVKDRVATVTLNRPERYNAQTRRMHAEIRDAADRWDNDDDVRVVIFTGAGKAFCSGTDLRASWSADPNEEQDLPATIVNGIRRDSGGPVILRLFESRKPMIAAINGVAVGIGVTMTLPMDVRIAVDSARFGLVFTQRGICPESCSSWFLPRLVGITKALDWVNTGRIFPASEALQGGLVSEIVAPEKLLERAHEIAHQIADNTAAVSVALSRQLLWRGLGASHPMDMHEMESQALTTLTQRHDAAEAAKAFVEKRPAVFTDRPSVDMPASYPWWKPREFTGRIAELEDQRNV